MATGKKQAACRGRPGTKRATGAGRTASSAGSKAECETQAAGMELPPASAEVRPEAKPRHRAVAPSRSSQFVRRQIAAELPRLCAKLLSMALDEGDMGALKLLLQMAMDEKGNSVSKGTKLGARELGFARKMMARFHAREGTQAGEAAEGS